MCIDNICSQCPDKEDCKLEPHKRKLWEILVPYAKNNGKAFQLPYHHEWDDKVRAIAGGITIMKTAKGQWVHENKVYKESMIPVRIYCTEKQIDKIMKMTMEHYDQLAVMAHLVSENVKLLER